MPCSAPLLADQDGLYDPTDHNDRLLLGLTGIMSEAELHLLRGRMRQGLLNKVRRGEVFMGPSVGYVRSPDGGLRPRPRRAGPRGRPHGVRPVRAPGHDPQSPPLPAHQRHPHRDPPACRPESRPARVAHSRPGIPSPTSSVTRSTPVTTASGGGKPTRAAESRGSGGRGGWWLHAEEYLALIPDKVPAYITRDQYDANQRRLAENRARIESKGAPREGPSLLAGLVVCGRCGKRMAVHYAGRAQILRYTCRTGVADARGTCRHSLAGRVLDQLIADQVLAALQPGALELSLAAADDVMRERSALDENWRQRLERARTQAARIERQYQAAEPENRLVQRTLERRWEEALQEVRRLEEEYARFRQTQPTTLDPPRGGSDPRVGP